MEYAPGWITLPDGRVVEDRRSNDLQTTVLKLVSKMESVEENISIKLESVSDKIKNLDDRLTNKISCIESDLDKHYTTDSITNDTLNTLDNKMTGTEKYIEKIRLLEEKYLILFKKVSAVEIQVKLLIDAPKEAVYIWSKNISNKIIWIIIGVLGLGIVFSLFSSDFWQLVVKNGL